MIDFEKVTGVLVDGTWVEVVPGSLCVHEEDANGNPILVARFRERKTAYVVVVEGAAIKAWRMRPDAEF